MPIEPGAPARVAPSLAACIRPGPPPVTMSQPIDANAVATRFTSSYTNVAGCARAEPKMATRYRSRFDGRSRVRLLTTLHKSRTVFARLSLTASSSARLTRRVLSDSIGVLVMHVSHMRPHLPHHRARWQNPCAALLGSRTPKDCSLVDHSLH